MHTDVSVLPLWRRDTLSPFMLQKADLAPELGEWVLYAHVILWNCPYSDVFSDS